MEVDEEWPRRKPGDRRPIVHVSYGNTTLFPEGAFSSDDEPPRPLPKVTVMRAIPTSSSTPAAAALPAAAETSHCCHLQTKPSSSKKNTGKTTAYLCSHCGHEFGLRKTRDMHSKVCGQKQ